MAQEFESLDDKVFAELKKEQLMQQQRIGEHLLQRKLIKLHQLVEVMEEQERTGKLLGEILVEKEYITREMLNDALKWQSQANDLLKQLEQETREQIVFKKAD